jgi:hypothetical protein
VSAIERLRSARRQLALAVAARGGASAAALGVLAALGIEVAGVLLRGAGLGTSQVAAGPVACAVALAALGWTIWRARALRSLEAVALWIEERQPALQYALVTAVDPRIVTAGVPAALAGAAEAAGIESEVRRATRRLWTQALAAVLVTAAGWLAVRQLGQALEGGETGQAGEPAAPVANRLVPLTARVVPPAYAHLPVSDQAEPATVEARVGSAVTFAGRGSPGAVMLVLSAADSATPGTKAPGDSTAPAMAAAAAPGGWTVGLRMPATPGVARLTDRSYRRLVVLVPRVDSTPAVVLQSPAHDTTYPAVPSTPIVLEARVSDDIGLAAGYFEYLISSGSGEHFNTVTRTSPRVRLGPGRSGTLKARLGLDTLKLTPGSVVNVRAVALDGNDVTGPGKGVSETRTLRIAEPRDSVSVAPAPPDQLDSMLVSQRLLNLRTDTLLRSRARLTRAAVADRAMRYSNVQESIRLRVVAVVALLEDDGVGGTAPTDVSRLLRTAGEAMQEARIELALAAPDRAMPHMRRALAILDQVRNAHRYYIRGRTPPVLVDLDRVRLQGQGTPEPGPRTPRDRLADRERLLAERIERAAGMMSSAREPALDSLTFIRVAALEGHADLAEALAQAVARLRQGDQPGPALAQARRLLSRAAEPLDGSPDWLGVRRP